MVAQLVDARSCLLCRYVPFPGVADPGFESLGLGIFFDVSRLGIL